MACLGQEKCESFVRASRSHASLWRSVEEVLRVLTTISSDKGPGFGFQADGESIEGSFCPREGSLSNGIPPCSTGLFIVSIAQHTHSFSGYKICKTWASM